MKIHRPARLYRKIKMMNKFISKCPLSVDILRGYFICYLSQTYKVFSEGIPFANGIPSEGKSLIGLMAM